MGRRIENGDFENGLANWTSPPGADISLDSAISELAYLKALVRRVLLATTPFSSAWEGDAYNGPDLEVMHKELRVAVGMSDEEWQDSPSR